MNRNIPPKKVNPPRVAPPAPPLPPLNSSRDFSAYTQWKSDSWRNAAVYLYDAIKSKDDVAIKKALKHFRAVKKWFPFREI